MADSPETPPSSGPVNPADKPTIPLEPIGSEAEQARRAIAGKPSILKVVDEKCPNCGARMDADAVVCMVCGYDMTGNRVVTPQTGVDEVEPLPDPNMKAEFVKPGGKPIVLAITGACVLVAAMVAAGWNAPKPDFGVRAAMALLVLYHTILHTGTGLAAVWCAAKYVEERFSRVDLAVSRMFLAMSVFWLVASLRIPIEMDAVERTLRWPIALAVYWLAIFVLFRRNRQETLILMLFHVGAWMFVEMGVQIAVALEAAASGKPGV